MTTQSQTSSRQRSHFFHPTDLRRYQKFKWFRPSNPSQLTAHENMLKNIQRTSQKKKTSKKTAPLRDKVNRHSSNQRLIDCAMSSSKNATIILENTKLFINKIVPQLF